MLVTPRPPAPRLDDPAPPFRLPSIVDGTRGKRSHVPGGEFLVFAGIALFILGWLGLGLWMVLTSASLAALPQ